MSGYWFAVGACIALLVFLVVLLRTRRLREKYAIAWIVVGVGICVFGAFPGVVSALARLVGVQTPSNLLFALASIVLLLVCIQLSSEITTLEEETRTLTEEVALLRFDLERLAAGLAAAPDETATPPVPGQLPSDGPDPAP
ncbi:DUF2304 domain-containing protein [Cellulomonas sp. C5510]|uniref:DUF2304 domain-containing protein n=1 Tax=Cellulomonas sp. C5510 TaxID=2871170 RepID=UPI001C952FDF|nr:DUF2304 domain-containing protein [Cellulomonas sp. C5510]QZN84788.1 DUF2304 domain-containing protein [Cellulomonas sp. C5510]